MPQSQKCHASMIGWLHRLAEGKVIREEPVEIEVACHCGDVVLRVAGAIDLGTARRCNCSYCSMRGAVIVTVPQHLVSLASPPETLGVYRFHTGVAAHYFCTRCGIATHLVRRSSPESFGINLACISGMTPFNLDEVPVMDGAQHPLDHGGIARRAGVLRYVPDRQERG